jgi:hypothetical protein
MPARARNFAPSAYADYGHDHLFFARQQSHQLRAMDWEGRITPMLSWSSIILRGIGLASVAAIVLAIVI